MPLQQQLDVVQVGAVVTWTLHQSDALIFRDGDDQRQYIRSGWHRNAVMAAPSKHSRARAMTRMGFQINGVDDRLEAKHHSRCEKGREKIAAEVQKDPTGEKDRGRSATKITPEAQHECKLGHG